MKKWFAAIMALTMLCTLCACGGKETTPFHMKLEKGDDGYTCYGFAKPENAVGQVEIPADVNGTAVQYVGSSAFKDSDVSTVTISEGIEEIGTSAFANCVVLESVNLPQSLTRIWVGAFSNCTALQQIHIPAGVIDMELWAFADCSSLKTVVIEGKLDTLGQEVFRDCTSLQVIYLPETLTTIYPGALDGCDALEEIHFAGTAEEFVSIDFHNDWMSAENVLVCCADVNILMEDKKSWSHTDRQAYYPANPMDALFDYGEWSDPGPDETMSEDWSDPGPDETMPEAWDSSVPRLPHGYVEFTSDYAVSDADEFAMCIAQCEFEAAAEYLHPDLLDALDGDVTRKIGSGTMEDFGSGAIGCDPYSFTVYGSENYEMTLWQQKMEKIRKEHDELGIKIDFDNDRVIESHYNFGTICDSWEKFASLVVYTDGSEVLDFAYVGTN